MQLWIGGRTRAAAAAHAPRCGTGQQADPHPQFFLAPPRGVRPPFFPALIGGAARPPALYLHTPPLCAPPVSFSSRIFPPRYCSVPPLIVVRWRDPCPRAGRQPGRPPGPPAAAAPMYARLVLLSPFPHLTQPQHAGLLFNSLITLLFSGSHPCSLARAAPEGQQPCAHLSPNAPAGRPSGRPAQQPPARPTATRQTSGRLVPLPGAAHRRATAGTVTGALRPLPPARLARAPRRAHRAASPGLYPASPPPTPPRSLLPLPPLQACPTLFVLTLLAAKLQTTRPRATPPQQRFH